jgi:hypothetical protein
MTLDTMGFNLIREILSQIYSCLILPTLVSKIEDILDIPWVILENILDSDKWEDPFEMNSDK